MIKRSLSRIQPVTRVDLYVIDVATQKAMKVNKTAIECSYREDLSMV